MAAHVVRRGIDGARRYPPLAKARSNTCFSGSQRHSRSLVNSVPPHQRWTGLCRLKSSRPAIMALTEFGERQLALLVALVTIAIVVHLQREWPAHPGPTPRAPEHPPSHPAERRSPNSRTHAACCASRGPEKHQAATRYLPRSAPASAFPSRQVRSCEPGSSSSRAVAAGRNNGSALKSVDSRLNQSRGVGAR